MLNLFTTSILLMCTSFIFSQDVILSVSNINDDGQGNVIFDVLMINNVEVAGFQFTFATDGLVSLTGGAGGSSGDAGFMVSTSPSGTVLGFSMTGGTIAAGEGVLIQLSGTYNTGNIGQNIQVGAEIGPSDAFSDPFANSLSVETILTPWVIGQGISTEPSITSVNPSEAYQGDALWVSITGTETQFQITNGTETQSNVNSVLLTSSNGNNISASSINPTSTTHLNAYFTILGSNEEGTYDVNVNQGNGYDTVSMINGFEVLQTIVYGCTDPEAVNYNEEATDDDGTCEYDENPPTLYAEGGDNQISLWWDVDSLGLRSDVNLSVSNIDDDGTGNVTFDVTMLNTAEVGGFQFTFDTGGLVSLTSGAGGSSGDAGFMVSTSPSGTVLGFSMTGGTIAAGEGVLIQLSGTYNTGNIGQNIQVGAEIGPSDAFSDPSAQLMSVESVYSEWFVGTGLDNNPFEEFEFNIYRDGYLYVSELTQTNYTDGGLPYNETHCYTVTAIDETGESAHSNEVCATTNVEILNPEISVTPDALNFNIENDSISSSNIAISNTGNTPLEVQLTTGDEIACVDIDGNIYETVQIGEQIWTTTNLKVTHYRNGDPIPTGYSNSEWSNLDDTETGAYAVYNDQESNADTYGYLYNWYAVDDSRNIAPEGWHIPTDAEWQTLVDYLGGESVAGGKMKETGTSHWNSPNTGATNESGFTALPAGYRLSYGKYGSMGNYGYFWSSSEANSDSAWYRTLGYNNSEVSRYNYLKELGFTVRVIRDDPSGILQSSSDGVGIPRGVDYLTIPTLSVGIPPSAGFDYSESEANRTSETSLSISPDMNEVKLSGGSANGGIDFNSPLKRGAPHLAGRGVSNTSRLPVRTHSSFADSRQVSSTEENFRNEWLTLTPTTLTIQPGESAIIEVTANAEGLDNGEYAEMIQIISNDPNNSVIEFAVNLTVYTPIIYGCTDPEAVNYNEEATDDDGTCEYDEEFVHFTNIPNETGESSLIIIQDINGLQPGDEVGLFDINGLNNFGDCSSQYGEVLVGAGVWDGGQLDIIGVESLDFCDFGGFQQPGYISGNNIIFKIWVAEEDREYDATPQYSAGNGQWGQPLTVVSLLDPIFAIPQELEVNAFVMNMISFNVQPDIFSADSILGDLGILIARNDQSDFYVPEFDINQIGELDVREGYKLFLNGTNDQQLTVEGIPVETSEISITIAPFMMNMISYLPQECMATEQVFAGYEDDILIVKNDSGDYYVPSFGVMTLTELCPGEGYAIFLNGNTDIDFSYPDGGLARTALTEIWEDYKVQSATTHYDITPTGISHPIILDDISGEISVGDEVAAYANGVLVGATKVVDQDLVVLSAWGGYHDADLGINLEGYAVGDAIELRVWSQSNNAEYKVNAILTSDEFGINPLTTGTIEVLDVTVEPTSFGIESVYPNPFNPVTTIKFTVETQNFVSLQIFNINGQLIETLVDGNVEVGYHEVNWNASQHSSGVYFVKMVAGAYTKTQKIMLLK